MRLRLFNIASVIVALLACVGCRAVATNKLVSLCEVSAHPESHLDHSILVRASIISDGLHGVAIVDPQCASLGMVLNIPIAIRAQDDVAKLRKTIFAVGGGGTVGRVVTATLTGKLSPPVKPGGSHSFVLAHATDIEVKDEPDGR